MQTLSKAQRTRGLSWYHKLHTTLDQTSILRLRNYTLTSKSQPHISISTKSKFKILTKPSFRILTKIQLRNLNQTSAAKYWPNFSFKISPELQLQSLDQTLCSKSEQKFSFMTIPQFQNLQQTVADTILIIKSTKQESVSESVSQSVTSIANDRTRVRWFTKS